MGILCDTFLKFFEGLYPIFFDGEFIENKNL